MLRQLIFACANYTRTSGRTSNRRSAQSVVCRKRFPCELDLQILARHGTRLSAWRDASRDACRKAQVPHRLLHDCRRTAARNLIRAGVPERIAMLLTGHKTRAVFDRYNIVNEQELLTAGERLAAYVANSGS